MPFGDGRIRCAGQRLPSVSLACARVRPAPRVSTRQRLLRQSPRQAARSPRTSAVSSPRPRGCVIGWLLNAWIGPAR